VYYDTLITEDALPGEKPPISLAAYAGGTVEE